MKNVFILCLCALFTDTLSYTINSEAEPLLTCSKYHFEEKILEKLIRLEYKMEIFSEKMKIWEDLVLTKLTKFEKKMDSNDETNENFQLQTNNKVDIFEEQISNMSQSLSSNAQKLNEAERTRISEFISMQSTLLMDQEKFNHPFNNIVENFQTVSNETLRDLMVQQREDFSKMVATNDVIAFSAYRSASQSLSTGTIVHFNKVWTNIGNGYDPKTGIFTAPRSGLYHFTSVVLSETNAVYLCLYHNGSKISTSFINGNYFTGTFDVLLSLERRDNVSIKSSGNYVVHSTSDNYISFSGYIIK